MIFCCHNSTLKNSSDNNYAYRQYFYGRHGIYFGIQRIINYYRAANSRAASTPPKSKLSNLRPTALKYEWRGPPLPNPQTQPNGNF